MCSSWRSRSALFGGMQASFSVIRLGPPRLASSATAHCCGDPIPRTAMTLRGALAPSIVAWAFANDRRLGRRRPTQTTCGGRHTQSKTRNGYTLNAPLWDICHWDVATWSQAIHFWEEHVNFEDRYCLELGANQGGLSLWLAQKGCRVLCSDVRDTELRATPLHRSYAVEVSYRDVSAEAIPYESAFDIVVFKSMLGVLRTKERQRKATTEIHKALKPGGVLLFAENLRASPLHRLLRRRYRRDTATWRYVTVSELRDFLRPFTSVQFRTTGAVAALGATESRRTALAALDRVVLPIVPPDWRYLVFGIARK